jgi:hypothetical protein
MILRSRLLDPFGNYLCQRLLEFTNDDQRTVLVKTAAPRLVEIALNQHGTRALQKMIEFVSTPEQVETIVHALESKVVELIQDLNGNHVIQKCLNRLKAEDAQVSTTDTFFWFVNQNTDADIVYLRCCWRKLHSGRNPPPRMLRFAEVHRPCFWPSEDPADSANHESLSGARARCLWQLCCPVYLGSWRAHSL